MKQVVKTTVQTASNATVGNITAPGTTVTESTVNGPNDATIFDSNVPENDLKQLSSLSEPKATEKMESDTEVLYSVTE